jgi:hypothetical protein
MMAYIYSVISGLALAGALLVWETRSTSTRHNVTSARTGAQEGWAVSLLAEIGNDRPTADTVAYLEAWHRAEGGTATYNWLNTTQPMAGDSLYNSVGVRNYPDYETGIQAMARTLTNGYYPRTLAGLQSNAPVVDDGEMGVWGTGGGAVRAQLAIVPENGAHEATEVRAQLVAYALSLQGIPYVRGGRSAMGRRLFRHDAACVSDGGGGGHRWDDVRTVARLAAGGRGAVTPRAMPRLRGGSDSCRSSKITASAT